MPIKDIFTIAHESLRFAGECLSFVCLLFGIIGLDICLAIARYFDMLKILE